MGAVIGAVLRGRTPKNGLGCCAHTRRSGFRRQNAFWRRFADVRKHAPSRKKGYPILFRNHQGIPDFVNFPKIKLRHQMIFWNPTLLIAAAMEDGRDVREAGWGTAGGG